MTEAYKEVHSALMLRPILEKQRLRMPTFILLSVYTVLQEEAVHIEAGFCRLSQY